MSNEQKRLVDLIRRELAGRRYREVVERARERGYQLSIATISDTLSGRTQQNKTGTLFAIAAGLGITEEEMLTTMLGKAKFGDLAIDELKLLEHFRALPAARRPDALAYMAMLYELHGQPKPGKPARKGRNPAVRDVTPAGAEVQASTPQRGARRRNGG